jgi:hypothetical protein
MVAEYVPKITEWTYQDVIDHMGRKVLVTHVMVRGTTVMKNGDNSRTWAPMKLDEPRVGWIAGCRTLRNGKYLPPSDYGGYDGYEPACLAIQSTVFVIEVVFWPTEKPQHVAPQGISFDIPDHLRPYTSAGYGKGKERKEALKQHRHNFIAGDWERAMDGTFKKTGSPG